MRDPTTYRGYPDATNSEQLYLQELQQEIDRYHQVLNDLYAKRNRVLTRIRVRAHRLDREPA